jgi:putative phage-type endonuclease
MEFIETKKTETEKDAWLEKRKHYVTGTDAGKLIGVSPWGGKFAVWLDKTGRAAPVVETPAMKAGKKFESAILQMYAEEMDCKLEHVDGYQLITCDKFPRLGASLDGWNHDLHVPVDAKNIKWKNEKWGEAWTDQFPEYYKAQLQVQMMVTGATFAHLAVMFSGQDFFIYSMEYDEKMAQKILDASDEFWPYVEGDKMPEADGSDEATEYIKSEFARGDAATVKEPTEEILEALKGLQKAKLDEKDAQNRKTEFENRIKLFMGDATAIKGVCTWNNNKDSVKTDWEQVASVALASMSAEDQKKLIASYTKTKPGARVLRITAKGY